MLDLEEGDDGDDRGSCTWFSLPLSLEMMAFSHKKTSLDLMHNDERRLGFHGEEANRIGEKSHVIVVTPQAR